ncbi:unnamed protein product [Caenorhabditis bovis]|uniref:RING-type domain-containing protein n=1 Tax=Caenorhabditis bovis TaxID=2654633 RepID=A0A8S1ETZ8_9PELO|nr:unnamed protein product [Caenorhabditis bovis]
MMATKTSLVETVNINVDDFSETFLTCSTCLHTYDQDTRKPKLLPCSHSVCLFCLTQLASLSDPSTDPLTIKCPLCRDVCILPPGGVTSFPAAFFINQLLDVMQKQRKDVVPSCTTHPSDQLLYCETCDLVFCEQCQTSAVNKKCNEHTVVPLSIAIKRMSEIVVYRAKGRLRALDSAHLAVTQEIEQLDGNVDKIVEQINSAIQEVSNLVENRRRELIETVRIRRDEKRKVLKDQIELIHDEKKKLEKELESSQLDIRSMARKLRDQDGEENWQRQIVEPRENAFLRINTNSAQMLLDVEKSLSDFGKLYASNTFPGNSTIEINNHLAIYIENSITLITRDVQGVQRKTGGDPIETEMIYICAHPEEKKIPKGSYTFPKVLPDPVVPDPVVTVTDNGDGTYALSFKTDFPGKYELCVNIFGRPVKNSPITIDVYQSHSPLYQLPVQFRYPTKMHIDENSTFYVLDTGNNRIRVVKQNGDVIKDIRNDPLSDGHTVGMAYIGNDEFAILSWSKRCLSRINTKGEVLHSITFSEFHEPIDVVIDSRGRFVIGDTLKVFVFDQQMKPVFSFPIKSKRNGKVLGIAIGLNDDIIVGTTSEVLLYDSGGRVLRHVPTYSPTHHGLVSHHSVACCPETGYILAGVTDKKTNRTSISVTTYKGTYLYSIEYRGVERMSGPSCLLPQPGKFKNGEVFVVDNNWHNVRMFRYK